MDALDATIHRHKHTSSNQVEIERFNVDSAIFYHFACHGQPDVFPSDTEFNRYLLSNIAGYLRGTYTLSTVGTVWK